MLEDIIAYIRAIFRHWGPLATGVGALVVTGLVQWEWSDQAPWWIWVAIIVTSVFIASFLAWREIERENVAGQKQIGFLNTPSVSISLHHVDEGLENMQRVFVEVTGVGVEYVRPEVFATSVEGIGKGRQTVNCEPGGVAPPFGVHRGETHNVLVVVYDLRHAVPLRVILPCKAITSSDYPQGEYFNMKIHAYAGPKAAELNIEFGMDGHALWARTVGSSEKIYSDLRAIAMKGTNETKR